GPAGRLVVAGPGPCIVAHVRLERARGVARQPELAPRAEQRAESVDRQGNADRVGAEWLLVLKLAGVEPGRDDDPSGAIDRRVGDHHLAAGRVPTRRVAGASTGLPVTGTGLRVAGLQVVFQRVVLVPDRRDLGV